VTLRLGAPRADVRGVTTDVVADEPGERDDPEDDEQLAVAHQTEALLAEEEGDTETSVFHRRLVRVHEKAALAKRAQQRHAAPEWGP
jgi:mannose/cellobiose epimerase-like protein (N-acyl-D-glucosamine 2-epimerase family)